MSCVILHIHISTLGTLKKINGCPAWIDHKSPTDYSCITVISIALQKANQTPNQLPMKTSSTTLDHLGHVHKTLYRELFVLSGISFV